jgi:sulfite reductase alpha subunit-like flavoprotein
LKYPNEVKIAVSLEVDEVVRNGNKVRKTGLASAFIKKVYDRKIDFSTDKVAHRLFIKDSSFHNPKPETPMIMVGPGTGVVPFIGFM